MRGLRGMIKDVWYFNIFVINLPAICGGFNLMHSISC